MGKVRPIFGVELVHSRYDIQFLLRARRNEKELKVKPATSRVPLTLSAISVFPEQCPKQS